MIRRIINAAVRGVRNELSAGESGWVDAASAASGGAGYSSTSGSVVNPASAMTVSAVWDCVKKHSQAIASLPLAVYERQSDGRDPDCLT